MLIGFAGALVSALLLAQPAYAAGMPGQPFGGDTLPTYRRLVGWSTYADGFGSPGPVHSQYLLSQNQALQFFAQTDETLSSTPAPGPPGR